MTFKVFVLISVFAFFNVSCMTMSSLQTARTVNKGGAISTVAIGSTGFKYPAKSDDPDKSSFEKSLESFRAPIIEYGVRYGLMDHLEAGGRIAFIPGNYAADIKYQYSSDEYKFAAATGLGINYASFESEYSDHSSWNVKVYDFVLPQYYSYDFLEESAFYLNPRMGMRLVRSSGSDGTHSDTSTIVGANVGLALSWFILEYGATVVVGESGIYQDQILVGLRFGLDHLKRQPLAENLPKIRKNQSK